MFKMVGVFVSHELDAKIVNYQGKGDRPPHVLRQPWIELAREVPRVTHLLDK